MHPAPPAVWQPVTNAVQNTGTMFNLTLPLGPRPRPLLSFATELIDLTSFPAGETQPGLMTVTLGFPERSFTTHGLGWGMETNNWRTQGPPGAWPCNR